MLRFDNKAEHFLSRKMQKTKLAFKIDNEVFFFINNSLRLKVLKKLRQRLGEVFNIHVQALAYDSDLKRNILYVHSKTLISVEEKVILERFIKVLIKQHFNLQLPVLLADYKQVGMAEKTYTTEIFLTKLSECLKNKSSFSTPPLTLKTRLRLQKIYRGYETLRKSSCDLTAGKQIKLKYKAKK